MHPSEHLVGLHLAQRLGWFIRPQFAITWDEETGTGGSEPDFVCLDFATRMVRIVEVTTDYAMRGLSDRIAARQTRWFTPVMRQLDGDGVPLDGWGVSMVAYVRADRIDAVRSRFPKDRYPDVAFERLETAIALWDDGWRKS